MYVIMRTDQGKREYVAPSGSEKSFTTALQSAQFYDTREQAEGEACSGNESVIAIDSIVNIKGR